MSISVSICFVSVAHRHPIRRAAAPSARDLHYTYIPIHRCVPTPINKYICFDLVAHRHPIRRAAAPSAHDPAWCPSPAMQRGMFTLETGVLTLETG